MIRRVWSDEIRKRVGVDDVRLPAEPEPPATHYHVWVEKGWAGALSPRLGSMDEVHAEIRALATELGAEIRGSSSFPFSQVFLRIEQEGAEGYSLNATLRSCDGHSRGTHRCNRLPTWA